MGDRDQLSYVTRLRPARNTLDPVSKETVIRSDWLYLVGLHTHLEDPLSFEVRFSGSLNILEQGEASTAQVIARS